MFLSALTLAFSASSISVACERIPLAAAKAEARQLRADGQDARAREKLLAALPACPTNSDLLRQLAMIEAGMGNLTEASKFVEKAASLAPEDNDVLLAQAYVRFWNQDLQGAKTALEILDQRAPDYPESAALRSQIAATEQADRARLNRLDIGASLSDVSFANRAGEEWTSYNLAASGILNENTGADIALEHEVRGRSDTRIAGTIVRQMAFGDVSLRGTLVPGADFMENWSVQPGVRYGLSAETRIIADIRYADYDAGAVGVIRPGVEYDVDGSITVTVRALTLIDADGTRLGGAGRVDYDLDPQSRLFVNAASYPDAEAGIVRQLRSVGIGASREVLDGAVVLMPYIGYEDRDQSYSRLILSLTVAKAVGSS